MNISDVLGAAGVAGVVFAAAAAPPVNDNVGQARFVGPGTYAFSTVEATVDGPNYSCESGDVSLGPDIWFLIQTRDAGPVSIDTCGSTFDTTVAVYSGIAPEVQVACNDQKPAGLCDGTNLSWVEFEAAADSIYLINVAGYDGTNGTGTLRISGSIVGEKSFTYQGVLTEAGAPINGVVDLSFAMFTMPSGGTQVGPTQERSGVTLANGVFSVRLDFEPIAPATEGLWIETSVNGNPLTRERLASVPRAVQAMTVPWEGITGTAPASVAPWVNTGGKLSYSGGGVGIGVVPLYPLHVRTNEVPAAVIEGSRNLGTWFNLSNTSSGGVFWQFISTGSGNGEGPGNLLIGRGTAAAVTGTVMTMTFSGNVGIGTTAPAQRLHVAGNVLANNVGVPSSIRFKDHVAPMGDALERLLKLEGVRFDWKPEYAKERGFVHDVGFVAEDVEKVFPEIVLKDGDGKVVGMDYSRVTAVAVEAIKQLREEQKKEIELLRGEKDREIAELKERLERLERK